MHVINNFCIFKFLIKYTKMEIINETCFCSEKKYFFDEGILGKVNYGSKP